MLDCASGFGMQRPRAVRDQRDGCNRKNTERSHFEAASSVACMLVLLIHLNRETGAQDT